MDGRKWMAVFGHPSLFFAFTACRCLHHRCHHHQLMSFRLLNQRQD